MILSMRNVFVFVVGAILCVANGEEVNYFGHKVLTIHPKCDKDLTLLRNLRSDYGVDLWNEPRVVDVPVMARVMPHLVEPLEKHLKDTNVTYETAINDLGSFIMKERIQNSVTDVSQRSENFDFDKYNEYEKIVAHINWLTSTHSKIAELQTIGKSYENRPLYMIKISTSPTASKPIIVLECGIHAREWTSFSTCIYIANELITKNSDYKNITDKYEIMMMPMANPDGYVYTWKEDRLWRKTRSHSSIDWLGVCRGADANRNFDIDHCGVGTSRKPCDDIYCGDKPFSESESRALRDVMVTYGSRIKAYLSIHAFSQLWMSPYGIHKNLPSNYDELMRVARIGANALQKKYGTVYKVGTIGNIIYEAAGSSVDYAYEKHNIKMGYAIELRDTGRYGFFLPKQMIRPTAEETWDGIKAAVMAIK